MGLGAGAGRASAWALAHGMGRADRVTGQPSVSVNIFVFERDASAHYRMLYPAEQLIAEGYDIEVGARPCQATEEIEARQSDVVVVSRPVRKSQADVVVALHELGVRVVVDLDDDIEHLEPDDLDGPSCVQAPAPGAGLQSDPGQVT